MQIAQDEVDNLFTRRLFRPSMNRQTLLDLIKKRAIIHKEVILASGQKSNYYIDARSLFLHGQSATLIGEAIGRTASEESVSSLFD